MDRLSLGVWTVIAGAREGEISLRRYGSSDPAITLHGDDALTLRRRYWLIDGKTITIE
jgi:hypothetical protein